jgi:hypothetical protein
VSSIVYQGLTLGQIFQLRPIPGKVFSPAIAAGMGESNNLAATRIDVGDVWTLEAVAMDASESEIFKFGRTPMLPRDQVGTGSNTDLERLDRRSQTPGPASGKGSALMISFSS